MSTISTKEQITFDQFLEIEKKLDIQIGGIILAERIPKSNGLKLTVDFGNGILKTAFTNLGKTFEPEALIGQICPFIMNLEPSLIKGVNSEVMIMVGEKDGIIKFDNYTIGSKLF